LIFEKFLAQYGDDDRYELIDGELIDLEPTGLHEQVAAFILRKLNVEIDRFDLPWFTPTRCLLKPLALGVAFRPDVIVLNRDELYKEPLWEKEPIVTLGSSVKLAIEVVSTNWQNDYARKVEDYAEMGIPEYWAIDYLGLGGKDYIGYPKQPTFSVYELDDTRPVYRKPKQYHGNDLISSSTFPNLNLMAEKVFRAGR
jgi:Uma2 family endonuclease